MFYDLLKICVSIFFNGLNHILGGNLPPFGSAAVIVEREGKYLAVELPRGRLAFPGGFMRWREQPWQAARREGREETGLILRVREDDLINVYTSVTMSWFAMSTVSFVFAGEVIGGRLRRNIEGHPRWVDEDELRRRLGKHGEKILEDYARARMSKIQHAGLRRVS